MTNSIIKNWMIAAMVFASVAGAQTQPARKVRIGVVQPKVDMGSPASAHSAEAMRAILTQYLTGPTVELIAIQAALPVQVEAEATQKECDYILYSGLSQQAPKKSGFGLLKNAHAMTGMMPVIGMSGRTGAIVGQAAATTALGVAGELSSGVKAKSELTLEYRLTAPGAAEPVAANTEKSKADSDGQDVITPMVEHAAAAVLGAAVKK